MAADTVQRGDETDTRRTTRGWRWTGRACATFGLGTVMTAAMTTLAVASSKAGPEHAVPAAVRAQLVQDTQSAGRADVTQQPPLGVEVPHSLVGTQLTWLLSEFNGGSATITSGELRAHLSTHFLRVVPPRAIVGFLRRASDLRGSAVVVGFVGRRSTRTATAIVATPDDGRYVVRLTVEGRSPHLITSLSIDAQRRSTG